MLYYLSASICIIIEISAVLKCVRFFLDCKEAHQLYQFAQSLSAEVFAVDDGKHEMGDFDSGTDGEHTWRRLFCSCIISHVHEITLKL